MVIQINELVTVTFEPQIISYINTILKQGGNDLQIDSDVEIITHWDSLKIVIESRVVYCELFGNQFTEETTWLPMLREIFNLQPEWKEK